MQTVTVGRQLSIDEEVKGNLHSNPIKAEASQVANVNVLMCLTYRFGLHPNLYVSCVLLCSLCTLSS